MTPAREAKVHAEAGTECPVRTRLTQKKPSSDMCPQRPLAHFRPPQFVYVNFNSGRPPELVSTIESPGRFVIMNVRVVSPAIAAVL